MSILTVTAYILAYKYTFSLIEWDTRTKIFYTQKYQLELDNTNYYI